MKNFIQPGNTVKVSAPAALSSGDGFRIANLFGVASKDAGSGDDVDMQRTGVVELPKLSTDNMTVGLKVNWNDSNEELQIATSDLDNVATVVEAAAASSTLVKVVLTPV